MFRVPASVSNAFIIGAIAQLWLAASTGGPGRPAAAALPGQSQPAAITIDYPQQGTLFPPDISAPTFLWRDPAESATAWRIEVTFSDGAAGLSVEARGERMQVGEIDPRCVAPTNELPKLTPEQSQMRVWAPDAAVWEKIKERSVAHTATVTISGLHDSHIVSSGQVVIRTSEDPVGAPIFYRDVPLMPSELEKGVIKPLPVKIFPYVGWRLRYVAQPSSRLVMEGLHTCANCHSFSQDGKTLGMDLDGPHNDRGLYAIVPVSPLMSIRNQDVISWKDFRNQTENDKRIGFMSQVSPDGRYVVTATQVEYYVANFKDYRFLQVFYPTRGVLAWYNRAGGQMRVLPGADDPRYVQANAVWSPDGKYIVFARAPAQPSYPEGKKLAEYANDPNEVQIRYDLYRIPFNEGQGGRAELIRGASRNGMSNSFPKISPDGRWIVFVKSRNGQLMRPDGQLFIIPAAGGEARRMRCNTALMNSWHSFSPNGRWMVFSSKSRSPYTQMYLTHIDTEGNDSPPVLIENATAANRAVNIPEFLNIPAGGLVKIEAPATEFYRLCDIAWEFTDKGQVEAAIAGWKKALELSPDDATANNNFGGLLLSQGRLDEAEEHLQTALRSNPNSIRARDNLGSLLLRRGKVEDAIAEFQKVLELSPSSTEARVNLGGAFAGQGKFKEALSLWREALRLEPNQPPLLSNIAWVLATCPDRRIRNGTEAVALAGRAVKLSRENDPMALDALGAAYAESGNFSDAIAAAERALKLASSHNEPSMQEAMKARIALYHDGKPFREKK